MTGGWYRMQRGWMDHEAFAKEPYTEREAWEWLIANAAWKAHRVNLGGQMVHLDEGELIASVRHLAGRWRWGKRRVEGFIARLASEEMIERNTVFSGHIGGRITVCNYSKYQVPGDTEGRAEGTVRGQSGDKTEEGKQGKTPSPSSRAAYSNDFETFWRTYPTRPTDSKRTTSRAFERAVAEACAEALIAAAGNYRRHLEQTGKLAYAKGAAAWLNGAMWEGFTAEVVTMRDPIDGQPRRMSPCPL